jgi:DNA repair protein RecO (recombination protein O)
MNFRDRGIIIAKNEFKENTYVVTLFTENHGLYSGVIKQYGKKNGDILAESNLVDFFWTARLHEHLGSAKCELIKSYSSFIIQDKAKLYAFNSIVSLIKRAFCEREPHNQFFPKLLAYLDRLKNNKDFSFTDYIKLEIDLLAETGYQLSLEACAATGTLDDLYYVSPKSGQAVCREAGRPYDGKLLILPQFLLNGNEPTMEEKSQAFGLTSYFLNRYILQEKISKERQSLMEMVEGMHHPDRLRSYDL